jgi:hypothetical protein
MAVKNQKKAGFGWDYDEDGILYDLEKEPVGNLDVKYDTVGILPTFKNVTKNPA